MPFEADSLTRIKLAVMHLIRAVRMPLSSQQIVLALEPYAWVDRFSLAQAMEDLCETGFLQKEEAYGLTVYRLLPRGEESVELFYYEIPHSMRRALDEGAANVRRRARLEAEFIADYRQVKESLFIADLKIIELGRPLLALSVEMATRSAAAALCESWPQRASGVYATLMAPLFEETEEKET